MFFFHVLAQYFSYFVSIPLDSFFTMSGCDFVVLLCLICGISRDCDISCVLGGVTDLVVVRILDVVFVDIVDVVDATAVV